MTPPTGWPVISATSSPPSMRGWHRTIRTYGCPDGWSPTSPPAPQFRRNAHRSSWQSARAPPRGRYCSERHGRRTLFGDDDVDVGGMDGKKGADGSGGSWLEIDAGYSAPQGAMKPCENCNAALRYRDCFLSFDPIYSNYRQAQFLLPAPSMGPTTPPPPSCWSVSETRRTSSRAGFSVLWALKSLVISFQSGA